MIVVLALTAQFIFAASPTCPGDRVLAVDRPLSEAGKTFSYSFEYSCKDATLPTIIHIPGGPGEASIGTATFARMNANIIRTDPRGVGKNANYWKAGGTDQETTTESIADDIVALIEDQKLTDYSLHGISFGTAVATVVASKLEKKGSKYLPKAVILEGVVGRAAKDNEQIESSKKLFNEIKSEAGFCLTCKLDKLQPRLSKIQIGNFVDTIQSAGKDSAIRILKSMPEDKMVQSGKKFETIFDANQKRLHKAVACREFFKDGITDTLYQNGELAKSPGGTCDTKELSHPFDSADWQTHAKIYYVVGSKDSFTPPNLARYHFENQKSSNKTVLCVKNGGHSPIDFNIARCSQTLVGKMISNSPIMDSDLARCESRVKLDSFSCDD